MKEPSYKDNYPYTEFRGGDLLVVDDLAETDLYAEEVSYGSEERFEVRRKGIRLGRFQSLEDAKEFLDGDT